MSTTNEGHDRRSPDGGELGHRAALRLEARPLQWDALTEDQRDAAGRVLALIEQFVHHAPRGAQRDADERDDRRQARADRGADERDNCRHARADRLNSVILLDGPRGTGKTTVLLTLQHLLDAWANLPRGRRGRPAPAHASCPQPPLASVLSVGTLDLHPLGEDADLVLALGGLLKTKLESLGVTGSDTTQAWNRFVEGVAMVNVASRERLARVGPDQLSIELRSGVPNLGDAFGALVDAARRAYERKQCEMGDDTFFVFAIDDADLLPRRTNEVMQVLRAFYHPHVLFLLTGDTPLFQRALRASILEQLWGRLHALPSEPRQRDAVDPADFASELARDLYDRVIPVNQRIRVRPERPRHLLEAAQEQRQGAKLADGTRWETWLGRLSIRRFASGDSTKPVTLRDLLRSPAHALADPLEDDPLARALRAVAPERWRLPGAFPSRLRIRQDLELFIDARFGASTDRSVGPDETWLLLDRLWSLAVDRSDVAVEQERELRRVLHLHERRSEKRLERTAILETQRARYRVTLSPVMEQVFRSGEIAVHAPVRFDAKLVRRGQATSLPPSVGDTLALLLDAAEEDERTRRIGEPAALDPLASALVTVSQPDGAALPWPMPPLGPLALERCGALLRALLARGDAAQEPSDTMREARKGLDGTPIQLFAAWMTSIVFASRFDPSADADSFDVVRLRTRLATTDVRSLVREAGGDIPPGAPWRRSWLASLAVFLSPRFGLSSAEGRAVGEALLDLGIPTEHALSAGNGLLQRLSLRREQREAIATELKRMPTRTSGSALGYLDVPTRWPTTSFARDRPGTALGYVQDIPARYALGLSLTEAAWSSAPRPPDRETLAALLFHMLVSRGVLPITSATLVAEGPLLLGCARRLTVRYEPRLEVEPSDDLRLARWVLFDLETDARSSATQEMPGSVLFPGVDGPRWPMPPFAGGYDLERFAVSWNETLDKLTRGALLATLSGAREDQPRDLLLSRYLVLWWDVSMRSEERLPPDTALTHLLSPRGAEDAYERGGSLRWAAFKRFREDLVALTKAGRLSSGVKQQIEEAWSEAELPNKPSKQHVLGRFAGGGSTPRAAPRPRRPS